MPSTMLVTFHFTFPCYHRFARTQAVAPSDCAEQETGQITFDVA